MKLVPYLNFNGNAEEALKFYEEIFDGEITQLGRFGESPMPCEESDKNKIMHARLVFDGNLIMVSDTMNSRPVTPGGMIQLSLDVDDVERLEKVFSKMSEGGNVTMPLADQFWGAKFGMLVDKFGISWMFNSELKK
jgi:PhnB protein